MGGRYSTLPEPRPASNANEDSSYFAFALVEPNRVVLLHAGADVIDLIHRSIKGDRACDSSSPVHDNIIQKEGKKEDGSYEIQFRGHPFSKFASRWTALRMKRLLCKIVAQLYIAGWDLSVASDMTTSGYHTTWFFRQTATGGERIKAKTRIVSLTLSGSDSLTLINAPDRVRKALIDAVRLGYTYGAEADDVFGDDIEIKLNGGPWETGMLEEGIWARKLLLEIFRQFSKCQYSYYAVADPKGTSDSIFFIHQQSEGGESGKRSTPKKGDQAGRSEPSKGSSLSPSNSEEDKRRSSCLDENPTKERQTGSAKLGSSQNDLLTVGPRQRRHSSWQELPLAIAASLPPPDQYPFQIEQFFMVSLNRTDCLRLIDSSRAVRDITRHVLTSHWPHGLKREIKYDMAYEYRLNRSPWSASGADAVAARSLLTVLFEKLLSQGWHLLATLDMSRRRNDKSVFVLKKEAGFTPPGPRQRHFCLSMTDGDKIRIIRGDEWVVRVVKGVVNESWPYGISAEQDFFGAHELQLVGHPWLNMGNGNEPLSARVMMLEMLRVFQANNWRVVVSADISGRIHTLANLLYNPVSVDSWIVAMGNEEYESKHMQMLED